MSKLKGNQKLFVHEYLKDRNGTQAAIRAGYSKKTARITASKLLTKPNIKEAVEKRKKEMLDEIKEDQMSIINDYIKIKEVGMKTMKIKKWKKPKEWEEDTRPEIEVMIDPASAIKANDKLAEFTGVIKAEKDVTVVFPGITSITYELDGTENKTDS